MATLVLVRHGQSIFNKHNEFCGWVDVPLTRAGAEEAREAAKKLHHVRFDIAFTSKLVRAQQTLSVLFESRKEVLVFQHAGHEAAWARHRSTRAEVMAYPSVELNERYYGDLQGLNKEETAHKYGSDQVHIWRRSFDVRPPNGESLQDVTKRTIPYFEQHIMPQLLAGKNVLVVAHGNSLRSIVMHVEQLLPQEIIEVEMGTGIPFVYHFDGHGHLTGKQVL